MTTRSFGLPKASAVVFIGTQNRDIGLMLSPRDWTWVLLAAVGAGCDAMPTSGTQVADRLISLSEGGTKSVAASAFGDVICLMVAPLGRYEFPTAEHVESAWDSILRSDGFWTLAVWDAKTKTVFEYDIPHERIELKYDSSLAVAKLVECPTDVSLTPIGRDQYAIILNPR